MKLYENELPWHPMYILALCSLVLQGQRSALPADHSPVSFLRQRDAWGLCAGGSAALSGVVSAATVKLVSWFWFA